MKLTKKFAEKAKRNFNGFSVYARMANEDQVLHKIHSAAASTEHCAHVAAYFKAESNKTCKWSQSHRDVLVEMGLANEYTFRAR